MDQPTNPPTPAPTPSPASPPETESVTFWPRGLICIGVGIILMILAPIVQAITGSLVLLFVSLIIFAVGCCVVSFDFRLVPRLSVLAVMGIAIISFLSTLFLGEVFYDVVLKVLNSYTDPVQREFLPDPEQAEAAKDMPFGVESKSEMGSQLLEFTGYISFALGVIVTCLGALLKFAGKFRGVIGVGLSMIIIGLFLLLTPALPQYILDEVLREGTGYSNGAISPNSPVPWLFWPLFALDKASYVGGVIMWLGVFILILGLIDRLINRRGEDAEVKRLGLALFAIGTLGGIFHFYVLEDFLIPTAREIGIAAIPGWLRTSIRILGYTWWIPTLLGTIFFIAGIRTMRKIGSAAEKTLSALHDHIPEPSPSSGASSESSSSNESPVPGGAIQEANRAARRGNRGRRGGGRGR